MNSHFRDLFNTPSYSAHTPADNDVILHLRAEAESFATLQLLREEALRSGNIAYNVGPGKRRPRNWESLPEEDSIFQREKKTRSAYVSRFRAKEYEKLLENKVQDVEFSNQTKKNLLRQETLENDMLKDQIRRLQMEVQTRGDLFPESAECKHPTSPFSQVTGCSSPEQALETLPEMGMNSFPPLPPSFAKLEHVVESWSSDETSETFFLQ